MKAATKTQKKNAHSSTATCPRPIYSSGYTDEYRDDCAVKQVDSVLVFCRIKPLTSKGGLYCVQRQNAKTVTLTTPEQALGNKQGYQKEMQYLFKQVFDSAASQRDVFNVVALPLVENLLKGHNSLLFAYGVTGGGKTYTMIGDMKHRGIMPRCLDVLFRTISDYQAKKYTFKPDRLNGFVILSKADALLERQKEVYQPYKGPLKRKDSDPEIASQASCDVAPLSGIIDEHNMFAVFITYVEIYNNVVYDLLEEGGIQKTLQSKSIREDANHNMFVHGVTEIEIKSVEEAIEVFQIGQKRKRTAYTDLNAESSRSHSVFNIRLVQAPTNSKGEHVVFDKHIITISELSLVDLAGSERSSRTNNTGLRLREAGNINNSLMTLRICLEYLRENQQSSNAVPKKVPYRESKITHLFKNYFDGEGQVSMIVCVNPQAEDYDENIQVLKFAELTQEVHITKGTSMKTDVDLMPGRRKANKMFKKAISNLEEMSHSDAKKLDRNIGLGYSSARSDNCRSQLKEVEKENSNLKAEISSLQAAYKEERERLGSKLGEHENSLHLLNNKLENCERQIDELTHKLTQQNLLTQEYQEKEHQEKKFNSQWVVEIDKRLLVLRQAKLQNEIGADMPRSHSFDNLLGLTNNNNNRPVPIEHKHNVGTPTAATNTNTPCLSVNSISARVFRGMIVANKRHRRSRSAIIGTS